MNKVTVIFGTEQVNKIHNGFLLTNEEKKLFQKEYNFNSVDEELAFIKGIEEAVGWNECYVLENENNLIKV